MGFFGIGADGGRVRLHLLRPLGGPSELRYFFALAVALPMHAFYPKCPVSSCREGLGQGLAVARAG